MPLGNFSKFQKNQIYLLFEGLIFSLFLNLRIANRGNSEPMAQFRLLDTQQRLPNGQLNIDLRCCIICTIIVPRTLPLAVRDVDCAILCKTLSLNMYKESPDIIFCYGESPYSYCNRRKYKPHILLVVIISCYECMSSEFSAHVTYMRVTVR